MAHLNPCVKLLKFLMCNMSQFCVLIIISGRSSQLLNNFPPHLQDLALMDNSNCNQAKCSNKFLLVKKL